MKFKDLFPEEKPIIAVIHLRALPGSPLYDGNMSRVYEQALAEAEIFKSQGVHGIIIENFRDLPFYPERVPAETIASITSISRDIINFVKIPVGINVLRNDAESALAIATAVQAPFIRVNVHVGTVVSEQGIMQSLSHRTLRLRESLKSKVLIFADVGVKHAAPLASRGLGMEAHDAQYRALADALIVSGELTGAETKIESIETVRQHSTLPLLIGSGATPENVSKVYNKVDGIIVGSCFKKEGKGDNEVEPERVRTFMQKARTLSSQNNIQAH